jgi:Tol biopolymer transport system component
VRLLLALLVTGLLPGTAAALHRETPPVIRLTSGGENTAPGKSWNHYVAFSSDADLLGNGSTGRQVFLFSLLDYDCQNGTAKPTTPCPYPPKPYLIQVTSGAGSADNPSADGNGEWVAFDAFGALSGTVGPASLHRQIYMWNVITGEHIQVTSSADGENVRPQVNWGGSQAVFESTAGLSGYRGVNQVHSFYRPNRSIVPLSSGWGPAGHPSVSRGGNWVTFHTTSDMLGTGQDTGIAQVYVANLDSTRTKKVVYQITKGNGPSRNPYVSEKTHFVVFDSQATDIPGSLHDPGTKIFIAPTDQGQLPHLQQMTTFGDYGDCTDPTWTPLGDKIAFICTGDPLRNGTTGHRVFVYDTVNNVLGQLTGRGDVRPPIGTWISSFHMSINDNTDLTGAGVCGYQVYLLDYLSGFWTPATYPGQLPPDSIVPASTNLIGPKSFDLVPGSNGSGSQFRVTTAAGTVSSDLIGDGSVTAKIGAIGPDGEASVVIPMRSVLFPPFPVPGFGQLCVKAIGDGTGLLDCDGGHIGRDFAITRDHDTFDKDPYCQFGCQEGAACSTVDPALHFSECPRCVEGVCDSGQYVTFPCSGDSSCQTVPCGEDGRMPACNGPQTVLPSGFYDPGTMTVNLPISFSVTQDPGLDNTFCTADDRYVLGETTFMMRLTTGMSTPSIEDADFVSGTTITAPDMGMPFDCELLKSNQATGRLVGMMLERLDDPNAGYFVSTPPFIRDLIMSIGLQFQSKPLPTSIDYCSPLPCTSNADCDDGNPCNGAEECLNRSCVPGNPIRCDDGNACNGVETCDVATGSCLPGTPPNCDDGNFCTDDTCNANFGCAHAPLSGPCDDSNPCTTNDMCQNGVCTGTAAICGDGNACNGIESCDPLTGQCRPGIPPNCDDNNPCTDDSCDPSLGCLHVPISATCSDNNPCTTGDTCVNGVCTGTPVQCSDNNACNGLETCNPINGTCMFGPPPNCDDGNFCTTDSCDPALGCVHVNNTSACDDNNLCTSGDTCQGGQCIGTPRNCSDGNFCNGAEQCDPQTGGCLPGTPPNCDDGNPCTDELCDAVNGCLHVFNTAPCNDGNACTTGDACQSGTCTGTPRACNDGDICNGTETCDPVTGTCRAGTPLVCDDHDACTTDTCDPVTGCSSTPMADVPTCRLNEILQLLVQLDQEVRAGSTASYGNAIRKDRFTRLSAAAVDAARSAVGMSGHTLRRHVRPVAGHVRILGRMARRGAFSGSMELSFANMLRDHAQNVGNLIKQLMDSIP